MVKYISLPIELSFDDIEQIEQAGIISDETQLQNFNDFSRGAD